MNYDMLHAIKGEPVRDLCDSYNMKNMIKDPTCFKSQNGSLIDVFLTTAQNRIKTSGCVDTGLSDHHHLIYSVMKSFSPRLKPREITYRSYKTFIQENFIEDLQTFPFRVLEVFEEVDDKHYFLTKVLQNILDIHAPVKRKKVRAKTPPFMNSKLRRAIMRKAQLHSKWIKYPNSTNWKRYRQQRNFVNKLKRQSVNKYFENKCDSENKNSQEFWQTMKPFLTNKCQTGNEILHLRENDTVITDQNQVSEIMNDYFVTIASTIGEPAENTMDISDTEFVSNSVRKHINHPSVLAIKENKTADTELDIAKVTSDDVYKIISGLETKKSIGYDGIPPKILKMSVNVLTPVIMDIVNTMIDTSTFPSDSKKAEVSPLHKKNDIQLKENKRPVSILTQLSKIYELVINKSLSEHISNVCSPYLSAYRKGYSCEYTLLMLINSTFE